MSIPAHLARLQHLTGRLTPSSSAPADELARFERTLARHLRDHPDLTISGNRLPHEGADALEDESDAFTRRIRNLEAELTGQPMGPAAAAPLVFRRETAFRSTLLGNSVPEWGAGMAPAASYGPFLDDNGLHVWFDLFQPTRLISVLFAGSAAPVLRVPIWGTITGRQSYRIEAGSAWIASHVIARVAALEGHYTGLKITGGSLDLSQVATASGDSIVIPASATAALHLDLDQTVAPHPAQAAGIDAAEAAVHLPERFDLELQLHASRVRGGDASCTVFGCQVDFRQSGQAPLWLPLVSQVLVPYAAATRTNAPDHFEIVTSKSALCTVEGRAPIDPATTGWLLPAAKVDPLALGAAAGVGALCVTVQKGLSTTWRDLARARTTLLHPGVIVEPGLVTLIDFTASNVHGRQRWTLWRNKDDTRHRSAILLTFGKLFPFVFVSAAANSEGVFFFCGVKAEIDRPVDANGKPFPIRSAVGFGATLQIGETFHAVLLDSDLLDAQLGNPTAARPYSLALRNALFTVTGPRSLVLFGVLENGRLTSGLLALTHDIHRYLPTLPDPYVASYTGLQRESAAVGFAGARQALTGFVKWPDRSPRPHDAPDPEDPRAFVYFKLTPAATQIRRAEPPGHRSFRTGVATFEQDLPARPLAETTLLHPGRPLAVDLARATTPAPAAPAADISDRVAQAVRSGSLSAAVADLARSPTLGHISEPTAHVNRALDAVLRSPDLAGTPTPAAVSSRTENLLPSLFGKRGGLGPDLLMLLDVSSRADQMGVTLGPAIAVERDERGDVALRSTAPALFGVAAGNSGMPLQIMNMDVVTTARHVRAATLPQISWEPVWNIPLPIEGPADPDDTITVIPGLVVYDNDGIPTRIFSESPYPVPIAPLPVTRHAIKEFNDHHTPRQAHAVFTLPFGLVAQADFTRLATNPAAKNAHLDLNMPHFDQLRGGLQIKARPPASIKPDKYSASFKGWTFQLDNIRWAILGLRLYGSTLGKTVRDVFNRKFQPSDINPPGTDPMVPLERMELSGYGASIFSNYLDSTATSPTSARCSSTSSSAGRGTRWCRSAASSIRSASTSSGRSR